MDWFKKYRGEILAVIATIIMAAIVIYVLFGR
jgi:uncharacterized membrane protein